MCKISPSDKSEYYMCVYHVVCIHLLMDTWVDRSFLETLMMSATRAGVQGRSGVIELLQNFSCLSSSN